MEANPLGLLARGLLGEIIGELQAGVADPDHIVRVESQAAHIQ
jgi:hypothetical protein